MIDQTKPQSSDESLLEGLRESMGAPAEPVDPADQYVLDNRLTGVFLQQPQMRLEISTPHLMEALRNKLDGDQEFRRGWKANIAMQFVDAVQQGNARADGGRYTLSGLELTSLADQAASNFLAMLMVEPVIERLR